MEPIGGFGNQNVVARGICLKTGAVGVRLAMTPVQELFVDGGAAADNASVPLVADSVNATVSAVLLSSAG